MSEGRRIEVLRFLLHDAGNLLGIGDNQPALHCRHHLAPAEAVKSDIAERARELPVAHGAESLSRIVQHKGALSLRGLADARKIIHETKQIRGNDAEQLLVWQRVELREIKVERMRVDLDRMDLEAGSNDGSRDREARVCRNSHDVA